MDLLLCIIVVRKGRNCGRTASKRKVTLKLDAYFGGGEEGGEQCATVGCFLVFFFFYPPFRLLKIALEYPLLFRQDKPCFVSLVHHVL